MKHIILASASPRRKEILELADLKFDIMPSNAQEITTKTAPNEVVMELASIKAKDIYKKSEKQSMIVGADTVVAYQGADSWETSRRSGRKKNAYDVKRTDT